MAITPSARLKQQNIYDIQVKYLNFSNAIKYNDTYIKSHYIML